MSSSARSASRRDRDEFDLAIDVALRPDAALERLSSAINLPRRRALGLFKLGPEFVGSVTGSQFEIWERRRRAVHAVGQVAARGKGARIEAQLGLSPLAGFVVRLFFPLYAFVAAGLAMQPPDPLLTPSDVTIIAVGAVIMAIIFYDARRRQRRDLARFLDGLFRTRAS